LEAGGADDLGVESAPHLGALDEIAANPPQRDRFPVGARRGVELAVNGLAGNEVADPVAVAEARPGRERPIGAGRLPIGQRLEEGQGIPGGWALGQWAARGRQPADSYRDSEGLLPSCAARASLSHPRSAWPSSRRARPSR